MLKTMSTIKKIIFGILMLYMISGLSFFFLYSCSEISFVTEFIYAMNWDLTFFNDGIIGPVILFFLFSFLFPQPLLLRQLCGFSTEKKLPFF